MNEIRILSSMIIFKNPQSPGDSHALLGRALLHLHCCTRGRRAILDAGDRDGRMAESTNG